MENLNSMQEEKKIILPVMPDDIITYNILTRVPNESLVRFRCVCENWSKLFFHDPLFIDLRRQKYKGNSISSSGLIEIIKDRCLVFINHSDKKQRFKRMTNITMGYDTVVKIHQSLNGLLLIHCDNIFDKTYYVYNPITNCAIMILRASISFDVHNYFRLCYDPIREHYKVVHCGSSAFYGPQLYTVKILTLEHGLGGTSCVDNHSWREIIVPEHFTVDYYQSSGKYAHSSTCPCFCINGSLYWVIQNSSAKPYILGLDTCRETFFKIKLPNNVLRPVHLNEMGGLLCASQGGFRTHELEIWTLKNKDPRVGDEWLLKRFKINVKNCMVNNASIHVLKDFWPLAILIVPKLKFIIASIDESGISYFSYDMESEELEVIHGPTSGPVHWHVNSIASCFGRSTAQT